MKGKNKMILDQNNINLLNEVWRKDFGKNMIPEASAKAVIVNLLDTIEYLKIEKLQRIKEIAELWGNYIK
jgi:hypothetical protein